MALYIKERKSRGENRKNGQHHKLSTQYLKLVKLKLSNDLLRRLFSWEATFDPHPMKPRLTETGSHFTSGFALLTVPNP